MNLAFRLAALILIAASVSEATPEDPLPLDSRIYSRDLIQVYECLMYGEPAHGLMIDSASDTLWWGQFYPEEKFEIIIKGGQEYLPVGVYTGTDTCDHLSQYIYDPFPIDYLKATHHIYLVPLDSIPTLNRADCVAMAAHAPIQSYTLQGRAGGMGGYHITLFEDYWSGDLGFSVRSRRLYSDMGHEVVARYRYDSTQAILHVRFAGESSGGLLLPAFGHAGGVSVFKPPSDSFVVAFNGDQFVVQRTRDSLLVRPLGVSLSILKPPAQERFPRDLAILTFPATYTFKPKEQFRDELQRTMTFVSEQKKREMIWMMREQADADFVLLDTLVGSWGRLVPRDSLNYVMVLPYDRNPARRPVLAFRFDGDPKRVRAVFDSLRGEYPDVRLFWAHW